MVLTRRFATLVTLLVTLNLSMTAHGKNVAAERCEQQWRLESAKATEQVPPDYLGLLQRWQKDEKQCAGTIAYEARLALAYVFVKQPDKAREVLKPLIKVRSDYSYLVDFSQLQIDYFTELLYGVSTMENVRKLEGESLAFVKKYPDFPDGYGILGGLQTLLGKHSEAIKSLEVGLHSTMDVSGVYRNLTISYTEVGRYEEAIRASGKAVELNKGLTSDQYFAYALAKADAAVGNLREAEIVLRVIATKKPEARRDPEFKKAVDFVTSKMDANKGTK